MGFLTNKNWDFIVRSASMFCGIFDVLQVDGYGVTFDIRWPNRRVVFLIFLLLSAAAVAAAATADTLGRKFCVYLCGVCSWWSTVVVDGWCRCVFLVKSIYFRTCDVCLFASCEDIFLLFPPITMRKALQIAHERTNWRSESLDVGFLCIKF